MKQPSLTRYIKVQKHHWSGSTLSSRHRANDLGYKGGEEAAKVLDSANGESGV